MKNIPILKTEAYIADNRFRLKVHRQLPQQDLENHSHDFTEIAIVFGGKAIHRIFDSQYPIKKGDVFVINKGTHHGYLNTRNLQLINILFEAQYLPGIIDALRTLPGYLALFHIEPQYRHLAKLSHTLRLNPTQLKEVLKIVELLESEIENKKPGFQCLATSHFLHLAGYLSRSYTQKNTSDFEGIIRVAEIISFLEKNFERPITIDSLCDEFRISERTLARIFKNAIGTSPIDYLIRLRISRAAGLLHNPDLSITEIAFKVGFSDSNYFTRQFRKITNKSPRQFRKQLGGLLKFS